MKDWLLMRDIIEEDLSNKTWITLLSYIPTKNRIILGYEGYQREYDCIKSIIVKNSMLKKVESLQLTKIWLSGNHQPSAYKKSYTTLQEFSDYHSKIKGQFIVHQREHPFTSEIEISISEDLIYALDLYKKGRCYYNPHEDDDKAIEIYDNLPNNGYWVRIKKEYILDYLSARNMSLLIDRYFERQYDTSVSYFDEDINELKNLMSFNLRNNRILTNGNVPGSSTMIMKAAYKDVDLQKDIPEYALGENVEVETKEIKHEGEGINHFFAEFRRLFILKNNNISVRIRRDEVKQSNKFYVDNTNKKVISEELLTKIQFLWFKPEIIKLLLESKYCHLIWHTKETGSVGNIESSIWFGVNSIGLINIFAKDIVELPEYYQNKWVAFNCPPNGGVSKELLMAQIQADPAGTKAAEKLFNIATKEFEQTLEAKFGEDIFTDHADFLFAERLINRFQAISKEDCFTLCKNINRYITERLNKEILKKHTPEMNNTVGTLKRLEKLLMNKNENGSKIISPLFVVYDMRIVDSHYISNDSEKLFLRLGIKKIPNEISNFIGIAERIILLVAKCLHEISEVLK